MRSDINFTVGLDATSSFQPMPVAGEIADDSDDTDENKPMKRMLLESGVARAIRDSNVNAQRSFPGYYSPQ